jgi:peroxiredoxin
MKNKTPVLLKKAPYIAVMAIMLLFVNILVFGSDDAPAENISFELTDMDGNIWKSEDLKGSVVVFNFWFSACPPCKREMPELNRLVEEYKNEKVVFIGVSLDSEDRVEEFTYMHTFNYKLIPEGDGFIDENHVSSFPTQFIVNKDGILVKRIIGAVTYDQMKSRIDKTLYN